MAIYWYNNQAKYRISHLTNEYNKFILKGLMADWRFNLRCKIYLRRIFDRFDKYSSVSFFKRSCLLTGHARSVFRRFKLVRHQAKFYGSHGFIVGLRKASF